MLQFSLQKSLHPGLTLPEVEGSKSNSVGCLFYTHTLAFNGFPVLIWVSNAFIRDFFALHMLVPPFSALVYIRPDRVF